MCTSEMAIPGRTMATAALRAPVAAAPGAFVALPVTVPVVVPFAIAALLLLSIEVALRTIKSGTGRALALTTLGVLTLGASDTADETPAPNAETLLRAGLASAARGSWQEAEARFRAAALSASDRELAAIAFHDAGVAAIRQRRLPAARQAFLESLAATSPESDLDRVARTQWNLEWVLARTSDEPAPEPPRIPKKQGENQKQTQQPREDGDTKSRASPTPATSPLSRTGENQRDANTPREVDPTVRPAERQRSTGAPELDERTRTRWLEQVSDDPRRAFLASAYERPGERAKRPSGRPTW